MEVQHVYLNATSIDEALAYIGIDANDFNLRNSDFTRPVHAPIHGIGHLYRTMIACALIGQLTERPREALLAFCGAYIHDLGRTNDGVDPSHGANSVRLHFARYRALWTKYHLTQLEQEWVKQAVVQHSSREYMQRGDAGYAVMAILKDADALDRCRIGDLNPDWLRFPESRRLVKAIAHLYCKNPRFNQDMPFAEYVRLVSR